MEYKYIQIFASVFISIILLLSLSYYNSQRQVVIWSPKIYKTYNNNSPLTIVYSSYNVSYYNSKPFVKMNAEILKNFCDSHGSIYKQFIHPDDFMSPYWLRVHDLYNLCNFYPENSIIVYMDADAVFIQNSISINDFLNSVDYLYGSKKDIYISEDPMIEHFFYSGIFNTGCFMIRNNQKTKEFVKEWLSQYNNGGNKWGINKNVWSCTNTSYNTPCLWSQDGYEQGEFSNMYKVYAHLIRWLHWSTLASKENNPENCYVWHMMGASDSDREREFKKILNSY